MLYRVMCFGGFNRGKHIFLLNKCRVYYSLAYLYTIKQIKRNEMKIQAKDLKVGMTVRDGYLSIDAEEIVKGTLKNGKDTVTVFGKGVRTHGKRTKQVSTYKRAEMTFKALTSVKVY